MKRLSLLSVIGLTALIGTLVLLPVSNAMAQGPVEGQNKETDDQSGLVLVPVSVLEIEGGNALVAEMPAMAIPSQGVPEADLELIQEIPDLIHQPGGNDPSAATLFEGPPSNLPSLGNRPVPDASGADVGRADVRPASRLLSGMEPQVKAVLSTVADQLLGHLDEWLHKEADEVSNSFNRWLHQEVDRLLASFESWLAEQLSEIDGAEGVELAPLEG